MTPGVAVKAVGGRRAFEKKVVLAGLDVAVAPGEFVARATRRPDLRCATTIHPAVGTATHEVK
jgi:hypothetical protein